ncbi:MAG: hypothetical protein WB781_27480, partial [Candidatus Sulfotelmatobacter sp.]
MTQLSKPSEEITFSSNVAKSLFDSLTPRGNHAKEIGVFRGGVLRYDCRMKSLWFAVIILCIFQIGCNKSGSAPSQQQTVDEADRAICNKHQARAGACGEYKVLSYDATWENGLGNQGAYVLERDGLTIHAHCGCDDCSDFADAVGTIVIADKSIGNLVTRYEPLCEDPL